MTTLTLIIVAAVTLLLIGYGVANLAVEALIKVCGWIVGGVAWCIGQVLRAVLSVVKVLIETFFGLFPTTRSEIRGCLKRLYAVLQRQSDEQDKTRREIRDLADTLGLEYNHEVGYYDEPNYGRLSIIEDKIDLLAEQAGIHFRVDGDGNVTTVKAKKRK